RVGVATSIQPLLELLPRRTLNMEHLTEFLVLPGLCIQETPGDSCAFEGVRRVGAGSAIVARAGRTVETRVLWSWEARAVDPGTDSVEELGAQYRELLQAAVRERVHGRTASHFSGGMDSTALALIADEHLRATGGEPLHALSLVYERLSGLARERPYLEAALQAHPQIVAHRIPGDDLLDYDSLEAPPPHEEPWSWLPRIAAERVMLDLAAEAGIETLFTGVGADELLDVPPYHIAEELRRGRPRAAWREASRKAAAHTCGVWTILYEYGLVPLLPPALRSGPRAWLHGGRVDWNGQNNYTIPPWVRPDFAQRHQMSERVLANFRRVFSGHGPAAFSVAVSSIAARHGDLSRRYLAAERGVHIAHPFFDQRLAALMLGAQLRLRPEPGVRKPVLAEATRGLLPEEIRTRRIKGHFGEACYLGLARNLPRLEALVRSAPVEDLDLIDKRELLECLRSAAMGVPTRFGIEAIARLNLTLSLLKWLSMQEQWLRKAPAPAETRALGSRLPGAAANGRRESAACSL
ncbi:MAG TPA: asparagine synthase-related protein, partial [Armatimonadota bacterium]|nr:asparagine synthase-related protein [Armatimonadota bacterium]